MNINSVIGKIGRHRVIDTLYSVLLRYYLVLLNIGDLCSLDQGIFGLDTLSLVKRENARIPFLLLLFNKDHFGGFWSLGLSLCESRWSINVLLLIRSMYNRSSQRSGTTAQIKEVSLDNGGSRHVIHAKFICKVWLLGILFLFPLVSEGVGIAEVGHAIESKRERYQSYEGIEIEDIFEGLLPEM